MKPFRRENLRLHALREILHHNVDDERFLYIFGDFARLIRTSIKLCDPEFPEDEVNYIEELLGLSFVLLQTEIRRVSEAAAKFVLLRAEIRRGSEAAAKFVLSRDDIRREAAAMRALGDPYKDTGKRLAELIWGVGNYYKHCDEWGPKVWKDKEADEEENNGLKRSRKTRRLIGKVGIKRCTHVAGRAMRTAYDLFEIDWASDCTPLAHKVQEWANAVYETCASP